MEILKVQDRSKYKTLLFSYSLTTYYSVHDPTFRIVWDHIHLASRYAEIPMQGLADHLYHRDQRVNLLFISDVKPYLLRKRLFQTRSNISYYDHFYMYFICMLHPSFLPHICHMCLMINDLDLLHTPLQ